MTCSVLAQVQVTVAGRAGHVAAAWRYMLEGVNHPAMPGLRSASPHVLPSREDSWEGGEITGGLYFYTIIMQSLAVPMGSF